MKQIPDFRKIEIFYTPKEEKDPTRRMTAMGWRWTDGKEYYGDYVILNRKPSKEEAANIVRELFRQAIDTIVEVEK